MWKIQEAPGLFGQIVSLPGGKVGPPLTIRVTPPNELELHAGIAYSPVDRVFLIAVGLINDDDNGSFFNDNGPTRLALELNQHGVSVGEAVVASDVSQVLFAGDFHHSW